MAYYVAHVRQAGAVKPLRSQVFKDRASADRWLDAQRESARRSGWGDLRFEALRHGDELKGDHEDRLVAARAANYRAAASRRFLVLKVDGKAPGRELLVSRSDMENIENDRGCWEVISVTSRRVSKVGRGCKRPTGILDGAKKRRTTKKRRK